MQISLRKEENNFEEYVWISDVYHLYVLQQIL